MGEDVELFQREGKEADASLAAGAALARLSPISSRVEPALGDPVSKLAQVASLCIGSAAKIE